MADKKTTKTIKPKLAKIEPETKTVIKKRFAGVVVSHAMEKTIVVRVDSVRVHPKYKKRYTVSKKYKVHDEKNQFKEKDLVIFILLVR